MRIGWKRVAVGLSAGAAVAFLACSAIPAFSLADDAGSVVDSGGSGPDGGPGPDAQTTDVWASDAGMRLMMFVTGEGSPGDFAGDAEPQTAADVVCARAALEIPQLKGTKWRAIFWSNPSTAPFGFISGLPADGWYQVRIRGEVGKLVFALDGGRTEEPILTQSGDSLYGYVWTGGSNVPKNDCEHWTSRDAASLGSVGTPLGDAATWLYAGETPCSADGHFYCAQLP
ncbi:MAG: hypothetical protein U0174_14435 [Polyangiaceae bacterium]